jgi:hypothetical protein
MDHQMTSKNTVTIVTPPDLHINVLGPIVLLLGVDLEGSKPYTAVYERLFKEVEINFFVSENGFDYGQVAWYRAVAGMASSVFINVENATREEIYLASQIDRQGEAMVFWISEDMKSSTMLALLNSYQIRLFHSLDEIETFLVDGLKNS